MIPKIIDASDLKVSDNESGLALAVAMLALVMRAGGKIEVLEEELQIEGMELHVTYVRGGSITMEAVPHTDVLSSIFKRPD